MSKNRQIKLLIIDNYDSFTFNLVQLFGELGEFASQIIVFKNDQISIQQIKELQPSHIVISPGPGNPMQAGISMEVIKYFYKQIPILGVCLGHQCIAAVFGGKIIHAPELFHGKTSLIKHSNKSIFEKIKNPFIATRYHSLIVSNEEFPKELEIIAWIKGPKKSSKNDFDLIMGLKHKDYLLFGVQFHPESILTTEGRKILFNFLMTTY